MPFESYDQTNAERIFAGLFSANELCDKELVTGRIIGYQLTQIAAELSRKLRFWRAYGFPTTTIVNGAKLTSYGFSTITIVNGAKLTLILSFW